MNHHRDPHAPSPPHPTVRRSVWRWAVAIASWLYLAGVVAVWLLLLKADEWWPATILLFSPRWLFALPLVILLPAALYRRSKWTILTLLAATLIVAGPVSSFNVPWRRIVSSTPAGKPFRIMTLNMHYSRIDPAALEELIADEQPDVVCIQEWSGWQHSSLNSNPEWHVHVSSGLFLASRHPIAKVVELGRNSTGEHALVARYELDTPLGLVHVFSLHMASDRKGIAATINRNEQGPSEMRANSLLRRKQSEYVAKQASELSGPILIVGDFNTPPESTIFAEVWNGYTDCHGAASWGWGYTFRGGKTWARIDHVLAGPGWQVTACRVGPYVNSPHWPVIADLVWPVQ